jgi:hypothetical protein
VCSRLAFSEVLCRGCDVKRERNDSISSEGQALPAVAVGLMMLVRCCSCYMYESKQRINAEWHAYFLCAQGPATWWWWLRLKTCGGSVFVVYCMRDECMQRRRSVRATKFRIACSLNLTTIHLHTRILLYQKHNGTSEILAIIPSTSTKTYFRKQPRNAPGAMQRH